MKKLLFVFTVMFGLAFSSCGNETNSANDVDSTKVDSTVVDSTAMDTLVVDSTVVDTVALSLLNK